MHQINTILIDGPKTHSLGSLTYEHIPSIGDWIEHDPKTSPALIYQVIRRVHPTPPLAIELHVKLLGPSAQTKANLSRKRSSGQS